MIIIKTNCQSDNEKEGWNCIDFVYPIRYMMPDGSIIEMQNKNDWTEIKHWYADNLESKEMPIIQFPLNIIDKNDGIQTIQNNAGMESVKMGCLD